MDSPGEAALHGGVVDRVVAEGHIAYNHIKIAVRNGGCFKALRKDGAVGVKVFGNAGSDGVQFHADPLAAEQWFRHQAEEVADTHGRLQDLDRSSYAERLQPVPDRTDNQGGREVRVGSRTAG